MLGRDLRLLLLYGIEHRPKDRIVIYHSVAVCCFGNGLWNDFFKFLSTEANLFDPGRKSERFACLVLLAQWLQPHNGCKAKGETALDIL